MAERCNDLLVAGRHEPPEEMIFFLTCTFSFVCATNARIDQSSESRFGWCMRGKAPTCITNTVCYLAQSSGLYSKIVCDTGLQQVLDCAGRVAYCSLSDMPETFVKLNSGLHEKQSICSVVHNSTQMRKSNPNLHDLI